MKQDLFSYLPSEIMEDILSRLPAQSILSCKCVCKWLHDLVETREFAQFHLSKSKSVSGLAITGVPNRDIGKPIELANVLHFSTITTFSFINQHTRIEGSADGLLLLKTLEGQCRKSNRLYLCNPITREYINLRYHIYSSGQRVMNYGFGVSKISGQYKAVSICMVRRTYECDCKVYTIGTGCWRSIAPQPYYSHTYRRAVFVNGNLHWVVYDINQDSLLISCFDLETELFTTFCLPPLQNEMRSLDKLFLDAGAEDSLCLCDRKSRSDLITIWKMKEYGNEKSWTKEFVITDIRFNIIYPITISKDGVIWKPISGSFPLCYSGNNKITQTFGNNTLWFNYVSLHSHIPSLVSLKCFEMENVFSF